MSESDVRVLEILAQKRAWEAASARGDTAAMQTATRLAEDLRQQLVAGGRTDLASLTRDLSGNQLAAWVGSQPAARMLKVRLNVGGGRKR